MLIPGKNPNSEQKKVHELAFHFWMNGWNDFFAKYHPEFKMVSDDFFRQDYVSVFMSEQKPVGVLLHSIFDIGQSYVLGQSYLRYNFSGSYYKKLNEKKINTVMTGEALMIDPQFRSCLPLLVAQAIQMLKSLQSVDAIVMPARNDVSVAQLATDAGGEVLEERQLHGFPVSLMYAHRDSVHLNFLSEFQKKLVVKLFNTPANLDFLSQDKFYTSERKKAA